MDSSEAITKVFDGHDIRVFGEDGEARIVASDLAKALGYTNTRIIYRLVRDKWRDVAKVDTADGGAQEMNVLREAGVFQVLASSNKAATEGFHTWLFDEVFPQIRCTGSWEADDDGGEDKGGSDPDSLASEAASLRQRYEELKDEVREQQRALGAAKEELQGFLPGEAQPDEQELQLPGQSAPADADRLDESEVQSLPFDLNQ